MLLLSVNIPQTQQIQLKFYLDFWVKQPLKIPNFQPAYLKLKKKNTNIPNMSGQTVENVNCIILSV